MAACCGSSVLPVDPQWSPLNADELQAFKGTVYFKSRELRGIVYIAAVTKPKLKFITTHCYKAVLCNHMEMIFNIETEANGPL